MNHFKLFVFDLCALLFVGIILVVIAYFSKRLPHGFFIDSTKYPELANRTKEEREAILQSACVEAFGRLQFVVLYLPFAIIFAIAVAGGKALGESLEPAAVSWSATLVRALLGGLFGGVSILAYGRFISGYVRPFISRASGNERG